MIWLFVALGLAGEGSVESEFRDAVRTVPAEAGWFASLEDAPVRCPAQIEAVRSRGVMRSATTVPREVAAEARTRASPEQHLRRLVQGAVSSSERWRVLSVSEDIRVAQVTEVLGTDCVTWEPFTPPMDALVPVASGTYTLLDLEAQLNEAWAGSMVLRTYSFEYLRHQEVDIDAGMTVRDAVVAILTAMRAAGATDTRWTTIHKPHLPGVVGIDLHGTIPPRPQNLSFEAPQPWASELLPDPE